MEEWQLMTDDEISKIHDNWIRYNDNRIFNKTDDPYLSWEQWLIKESQKRLFDYMEQERLLNHDIEKIGMDTMGCSATCRACHIRKGIGLNES